MHQLHHSCDFPVPVSKTTNGISNFCFLLIFNSPIEAWWTLSLTPQHCINEKFHLLVQGIINIIADFLVVLIPIPVVLRLNLPMRQRLLVSLLFGAGFIVCFAGIVRTYYFYRLTDGYHDITWDAYPVWLSTAVELYIGLVSISLDPTFWCFLQRILTSGQVCTSIPPTKPFFARYMPKLISATSKYTQSGSNRGWTPAFASSRNINQAPNYSAGSYDAELSNSIHSEELTLKAFATMGNSGNVIHKTVQISQSSVEHLVT
jgi:hypothetical protein